MKEQKKASSADVRHEAVLSAMLAIAALSDGPLNPHHVVEQARDPSSVLHNYFEWDDTAAAEHYRLAQAGGLIRRVKFEVLRQDQETKEIRITTTRAFQSRPSQRKAGGGYEAIGDLLSDAAKRSELLTQVLKELQSYRKRFAELQELASVWQAIDDSLDDYGRSEPDGPTLKPKLEPKPKPKDRPSA